MQVDNECDGCAAAGMVDNLGRMPLLASMHFVVSP
jgi:hypothetical protein